MSTRPDALFNLADAMAEDILNTPDDEVLREVEEDFGDPRALANKFDQILERAEKQVFGMARSAASPQVRPMSLPDKTTRWVKGIFDRGSRLSEFLSSLTPRTLAWSATAGAVVILVQAAVITAVLVKEQGASSGPSLATIDPRATAALAPDVPVSAVPGKQSLSDEEIAALVAGGRQLMVAGDIPNARLVLQQAAEADNATAALELGATYDPTILQQLKAAGQTKTVRQAGQTKTVRQTESHGVESVPAMTDMGDIRMARLWYEKARDLGSTEAARRLEGLAGWKSGPR
jgi:hypothetical protein